MKLFECQNCGQPLYFENTKCESCGLQLGYLSKQEVVTALEAADGVWSALAAQGEHYRFCANAEHDVCNWLVPAGDNEIFCAACRHNRTIPDLANPENLVHWRKIEYAKHRLFYTLLRLQLPLTTRSEDPNGLAFDFLSNPVGAAEGQAPVMTGHTGGLITLNVAEADAPERERQRNRWANPTARCSAISGMTSRIITGIVLLQTRARSRSSGSYSETSARTMRRRCSDTMPTVRRRTGRSTSSPPMPARIRGRISPKPGRTIFIWSIRSKPRSH